MREYRIRRTTAAGGTGHRLRGLLCAATLLAAALPASAKPSFFEQFKAQYPFVEGTRLDSCNVCHVTVPRPRNDYGNDWESAGRNFRAIENLDSDGDGADNITEIMALTFPGDPNDFPAAATATPTPQPTATPTATPGVVACVADCNGDGTVRVDELITAVNIALGNAPVDSCTDADTDADGEVAIHELLQAVNAAVRGCE